MVLNYGKVLKELREQRNLTQQNIANAIGIKRSSYNQFEKQYDIIPIKRLNQIANYLNVSIDYLLSLTNILNYKDSKNDINILISSQRLKEFRKINKLTQEQLAQNLSISRSIIVFHENTRTIMGTPFLYTLCYKYQISADYLLGKIDYNALL